MVHCVVSDMDDKLFNCILLDKHHVLHQLLPPERHCGYTLGPRKHELCLINKSLLLCTDHSLRICTEVNCNEPNFTSYFISFTFIVIYMYCVLFIAAS